jgi:hypothetical protein
MKKKGFFDKIDFNKRWEEEDWERYFEAQDEYRITVQMANVRKKPATRIKFEGPDEVAAFEPIVRQYGFGEPPSVIDQLRNRPFHGDTNPDEEYQPTTDEDPHYWGEGAPLATSLIYRDCCRFAICTSQELDRYVKRRGPAFRRKYSAEIEALRFHANWVPINVAHGHRIGYAEDRIRGNIAKCRRALKHAELCITLLGRLSGRTHSMRLRKDLFSFAAQLRNALFDWVDELRMRLKTMS